MARASRPAENGREQRMTCKDCTKLLENLKSDLSKSQFSELRHDVQAIERIVELLQSDRIVELPNIEIGQELFYIDKYEKRVKSDTVSKLTFEQNDLGVNTGVWSDNYGFSVFFSDVGQTVFLTKEEAEAKLKELKE